MAVFFATIWGYAQNIGKWIAKKTPFFWSGYWQRKFRFVIASIAINSFEACLNVLIVWSAFYLLQRIANEELFLFDRIPLRYLFHAAVCLIYARFLWKVLRGESQDSRFKRL